MMKSILASALFVSAFNALVKRTIKSGVTLDEVETLVAAVIEDRKGK
jgi:hypothetical protein